MFDAHANFAYSNVAAPAPGVAGTDLVVAPGQGALFPAAPFNCTVWPSGVLPLASNAEIVRVTAIVGDTMTIVRAQEGTSNINIQAGYQIANTTSVKVFTDIESTPVISAGTTKATGPFTFADGGGVSFGIDTNGIVTASINPAAGGGVAISAGANSQSTGTVVFANSNGITFGLDGAGNLTASHDGLTSQSNQAFSAQGGSSAFQTLIFANSNGFSFSNSNGSVVASYTVPNTAGLITGINISAGTTSNNGSAFTFSNANGITFGMNGSVITASVNAAGGGLTNINVSAGTTSNNLSAITFSNGNGVTFGLNASVITASVNTGAATDGITLSRWEFPPAPQAASTAGSSHGNALLSPLIIPCAISFTNIKQHGSFSIQLSSSNASTTNFFAVSRVFGIYSRSVTNSAATNFSNSTAWVSHFTFLNYTSINLTASSQSHTYDIRWVTDSTGGTTSTSATTSGVSPALPQFASYQFLNIPHAGSLSGGEYIVFNGSRSSAATSLQVIRMSAINNLIYGALSIQPEFGAASDASVLPMPACGVLSFSTNSAPDMIALSDANRILQCNHLIFEA